MKDDRAHETAALGKHTQQTRPDGRSSGRHTQARCLGPGDPHVCGDGR